MRWGGGGRGEVKGGPRGRGASIVVQRKGVLTGSEAVSLRSAQLLGEKTEEEKTIREAEKRGSR